MWCFIESFFADPAKATLLSIFVGAAITWWASRSYYVKAGEELKTETMLLKKANMAIAYMLEHPEADIEIKRDEAGNPVSLIVSATAHASGKSKFRGVASNATKAP